MKRNLLIKLSAFVILLTSINAWAVISIIPPYSVDAKNAEKIVLGKIISIEDIIREKDGKEYYCGTNVRIKAKKIFKGGNQNFFVLMGEKTPFINVGSETLVIAYKNSVRTRTIRCNGGDGDSSIKANFYYEYYTPNDRQYIFPVDDYASQKFGGKWIFFEEIHEEANEIIYVPQSLISIENGNKNFPKIYYVKKLENFLIEDLKIQEN